MSNLQRYTRCAILIGLAATSGAYAQISSINSAVITPRVFNDIPTATGNYINNYPASITLGESGVSTNSGAFADRDLWNFSNNGTTPYTLANNDYFVTSLNLTLSGTVTKDNEAGYLMSNANGLLPGGDMQFIADIQSGFIGMFGGVGFWNSGLTATAGSTVTLGMRYFYDSVGGANAFQFWASKGGPTVYSPIEDFGAGVSIAGNPLGGYFQIQNDASNPLNGGQAIFSNITMTVPEPSSLALLGLGALPLARLLRRRS